MRAVWAAAAPSGIDASRPWLCYAGLSSVIVSHKYAAKTCYTGGSGHAAKASMYWFRAHLRLGSGLALVALVVQIAVSLVHAHFGGFTQPPDKPEITIQAGETATALPSTPAPDRKSNGLADPYCPVCALIHLAGTGLPSAPPALALPGLAVRITLEPRVEFALAASPHRLFQARAPPHA